MIADQAYCI